MTYESKGSRATLAQNTAFLLVLQIASYLLPLLLIPYLTRVLGVTYYGIVALGLAMAQVACVITDFGFNLSATYRIAKAKDSQIAISETLGAVMACKAVLFVLVACVTAVFLNVSDKYHLYQNFFWLMLLPVLGQTFQPIWFFQGLERMGYITFYTIASRFSFLAIVVTTVSGPSDLYMVALANGVGQIMAAAASIYLVFRLGYSFSSPGLAQIWLIFKESSEYFWSRAAFACYTAGGIIFLGFASTPLQVARYSAAEQLYRGAQGLFLPLSQALYPHMARHRSISLFLKVLLITSVLAVGGIAIGSVAGPWVLLKVYGAAFTSSYPVLVIFTVIFAVTAPSVLLGYPFLGALGQAQWANRSVIFGAAVQVLLLIAIYISGHAEATLVAAAVLIVEVIVLTIRATKSFALYKSMNEAAAMAEK